MAGRSSTSILTVGDCPPWQAIKVRLPILSLVWFFALISPLSGQHSAVSSEGLEYFEKHVRPVLVERCYECHAHDESSGGLLLDTQSGWQTGGDSGAAIVPGDVDKSLLIEAIRYRNHDLQMPPDSRLSQAEIDVLEKWVGMGAPDPRAGPTSAPIPSGMSIGDGRNFWSFRPVTNPDVPQVMDSSWVRTPIDAFILSKLEISGLRPAPLADRRDWIRRVTFDVIGLPPTPTEVDAFLNDRSADAVMKVIDRLLMSPQYGIRWGRHWLDVARYADSNGLDENLAFGTAWRYRDYVFDAFNQDKPFDRFLVEQVAGDLLPDANRETIIATGFLVLGAKVLAEPDVEKLVMDIVDEQLDTTGKAFMGMTFGCVRCHDHKFDPIKQTDYYAMAAIFKSTQTLGDTETGTIKHWNEHVFASDSELKAIAKIDNEIADKTNAASSFKNKSLAKLRVEARENAVKYLVAATKFDSDASLREVAQLAQPIGLHPRILHHCRLHLQYHPDHPFFATWHKIRASQDDLLRQAEGIQNHYGPLIDQIVAAEAKAKKGDPPGKSLDDPILESARQALHDNSGFLAVPPKPEYAFDADTLSQYDRLMEEARVAESGAPDLSSAMSVSDGTIQSRLPIHIRGSHRNLGYPVPREFPEAMRVSAVRPIFPKSQSGRLEFAKWMSSTQHPLTARVYVNRIWRWHFGVGLVVSTENFGVLGERPSHPELLDWLARRFMESGWSTKELHRLILRSSVYQMASRHPEETSATNLDPENRLLWKFRLQRLESEQIRDAILASSDQLDAAIGGKTVPLRNRQFVFNHTSVDHTKYDSLRRAAYLPVIRNNVYSLFEQFDFPDPTMPTGSRKTTTVAPQALWLMNSDLILQSCKQLAKNLLSHSSSQRSRVELAYQRVLGRGPSQIEINRAIAFVDEIAVEGRLNSAQIDSNSIELAWSLFCQSLIASNEFIYVK